MEMVGEKYVEGIIQRLRSNCYGVSRNLAKNHQMQLVCKCFFIAYIPR